ncbi:hypothetical protein [Rubrivirga sp.]|uniref:hypothetical protein n=1 Tax=Rubrivirga sp. TaxID=1885344 RepID=UPI003C729AA9
MGDDTEELTWETSPSEARFLTQLAENRDGPEAVGELYGRYLPLLAETVMTQN